jgi:hypothetical protein
MLWTYSPSEFDIPLSGRRDGENFEIELDPGTTTATISLAGACAAGQPSNTIPGHLNPAVYPETKHRISARDGATDTVERTAGTLPWGVIMRSTIEIRRDCRDPAISTGYYTRDPFGRETPADIAPSCESCAGGAWQLKIGEVSYHPTSRGPGPHLWSKEDPIVPQCVYTYESIWLCATTSEVTKRTKTKITDGYCQPKG